jgi:creatinine amidohydrolase
MENTLSPQVQMQFMRPGQLEAAARRFPVVYVPFGCIEWHGKHLPLGNDALKAHAILVKCAEEFGGVVFPPLWFHAGFDLEYLTPVYTDLFERLKHTGFRVLIGVSGHNIEEQIEMINEALKPVVEDGTIAGTALWEVSLSFSDESDTDHAAKWETSNMMFFYPDLVDMAALGDEEMIFDMREPWGIGGEDPRVHASQAVGKRNAELAARAIGKRAQELLGSLSPEHRGFGIEKIEPGPWWMV